MIKNLAKSNNSLIWMLFLTLSNVNIKFAQNELIWRFYTVAKVLPITKRVEIIDKKKFNQAVLDKNIETFMVHVRSLSLNSILIHLVQKAQIALLVIEEV